MTANTCRLIIALLTLTLLVGGCSSLGRNRSTVAPREQPNASALSTDLETLRHENSQLRKEQQALTDRIAELQRTLAADREEQKRFRESMRTNFDLLEQSVALTLSRTVTADMSKAPAPAPVERTPDRADKAAPQAVAPPAQAAGPKAMSGADSAGSSSGTGSGMASGTAMTQSPMGASAPSQGARDVAPMPVAMRTDAREDKAALEDPDLLPPASPTMLTAHREAKTLYEKGFALFARKDYDQAVIVFRNFLNRFPDDIYSDNAQFWIAESYLNMKRLNEAEDAYRAVLRNYEHRSTLEGFKTPDAIYRLGQLHQEQGDLRQARHYFTVLGERFPDTSAGRKAQRELATMGMNTAKR